MLYESERLFLEAITCEAINTISVDTFGSFRKNILITCYKYEKTAALNLPLLQSWKFTEGSTDIVIKKINKTRFLQSLILIKITINLRIICLSEVYFSNRILIIKRVLKS